MADQLHNTRAIIIWLTITLVAVIPVLMAATSPLLEWRDPIYIAAGFGGVVALSIMLLQPLLAAVLLPGLKISKARRLHRWSGGILVFCIVLHVLGLWVTSPPDVIDALLFVSATPFSLWGVIAMWSVFSAAALTVFRRRLSISLVQWRVSHRVLVTITVIGSVAHALMIEGTMSSVSKTVLCVFVAGATALAIAKRLSSSQRRRSNA